MMAFVSSEMLFIWRTLISRKTILMMLEKRL
nr:unnamed protein product [Callosobruchus analis]